MSDQNNYGQDVDKPHDTRLKELFRNKGAFVSLLRDCVKPSWADDLDEGSLRRSEDSFILPDFRQKEADVVYEATLNNGKRKVIFYVLLELQSRVDYRMPYRLMLYICEILRNFYNNADEKERSRKDFKFPAVIPIVFYSGKRKWTVPGNLREMFDGQGVFGGSLMDFQYTLIDAAGYDDENVKNFGSKLLKVVILLGKSGSLDEIRNIIETHKTDITQMDEEEQRILRAAVEIIGSLYKSVDSGESNETVDVTNKERVGSMFETLIANLRAEQRTIRRQGIEEGIVLNKSETAKRLLDMGLSVEQTAEATSMTVEEVRELNSQRESTKE